MGPNWLLIYVQPGTMDYVGEHRSKGCTLSPDSVPWQPALQQPAVGYWVNDTAWYLVPLQSNTGGRLGILILEIGPGRGDDPHEKEFLAAFATLLTATIQQKLDQDDLRWERQRYHQIFEKSPTAIMEVSIDGLLQWLKNQPAEITADLRQYFQAHPEAKQQFMGGIRFQQANPEAVRTLQAESESYLIHNAGRLLTPETAAILDDIFIRIAEGYTDHQTVVSIVSFGGRPIDAILRVSVVEEHRVLLTFQDITSHRQIERALQQALQRIELLFSAMPLILISVDRDDRVTQWNVFAEQLLGISANAVLNRPFSQIPIPWEWRPVLKNLPRIAFRNGQPLYLKSVRFTRPAGQDGFLNLIVTAIPAEAHHANEILIVGTDVTEQRKMEVQLLQSQKLEAIGQLAAGIAHEINTPIQFVGDNLQFIQDAVQSLVSGLVAGREIIRGAAEGRGDPERARAWLEQEKKLDLDDLAAELPKALADSQNGILRVANIVRAMKGFAHRESTGMKVPADINLALENTITVARNEWKYVSEVALDLDRNLPPVECHADEMNQVFLNILINAAHAVESKLGKNPGAKGLITVRTAVVGAFAEIRIQDSGAGIPEAIQKKIFEPFFTTKAVGKGTGQGLAIARAIVVEKHGGRIEFESREGEGTVFIIQIPFRSSRSERAPQVTLP